MYDLELSDLAHLTKKQKNELRLKSVERAVADTGMNEVPSMRKSKRTVEELKNKLVDPVDDKLNLDRNVRNESIDPRMFSYDSNSIQWSLKGGLIEANVDGNEDTIRVNAGQFFIHNDPAKTLSRYEILKMRALGQTYDPTRMWVIPETTLNLATKSGYWLYARLNLAPGSTACTIEAYEEHKEIKLSVETGHVMYKIAEISEGEEA
jgi:hypothetical protein